MAVDAAPGPRRSLLRPALLPVLVGLALVWALAVSDELRLVSLLSPAATAQPQGGAAAVALPAAEAAMGVDGAAAGDADDGDSLVTAAAAGATPSGAPTTPPPTASASAPPPPATPSGSAALTGTPSRAASESPRPSSPAAAAAAAALPDTAPLRVDPVDPSAASVSELLEREAREDAAEAARVAALPRVALPGGDAAVSFAALRRMMRDDLCAPPPATATAAARAVPAAASCVSDLPLTRGLRAFLAEYARRHRGAKAHFEELSRGAVARSAGGGGGGGGVRFTPAEAAQVRLLQYFRCCGGLGDQLKGFANAALAALLAPEPDTRALVFKWVTKTDLTLVWRPCPLATAAGGAAGGIDWAPPLGLPMEGSEADAARYTAMGLDVRGVAWMETEFAAAADIANAAGSPTPIVLAWGNYLYSAHWNAPTALRAASLAGARANASWWTASSGDPAGLYHDGGEGAGAAAGSGGAGGGGGGGVAAPAPVDDVFVRLSGGRALNAGVWCRLPLELRELLRLQAFCRHAAAAAAASGGGGEFDAWQLAPEEGYTSVLPAPPFETLRAPADGSFAELRAAATAPPRGRRRLLSVAAAGSNRSSSSSSSGSGAGRRGGSLQRQRQRRLQVGAGGPAGDDVCLPPAAFPASVGGVCANSGVTGSDWDGAGGGGASAGGWAGQPRGAGGSNLALQLLDWLMWPTPRLLARLQPLLAAFAPGRQYVVGVHMRTGGHAGGLTGDVPIAAPQSLAGLAACCVGAAVRRLARLFGARDEVLLLVFSDNVAARLTTKAAFRGASLAGMPVRVLDVGSHAATAHTDASVGGIEGDALLNATTGAFAEHFLLSAAHVLVRSRSGFSESAQAWGRVPLAYQLHFSSQTCEQVGGAEFRSRFTWERRRQRRLEAAAPAPG